MRAISQLSAEEVITIDGKTVRHCDERAKGKGAIQMVSARASANRLVLGQRQVDHKSNQSAAMPQLLQVLALVGDIVTIDAISCQQDIASVISAPGGDEIFALTGNQARLFEPVPSHF